MKKFIIPAITLIATIGFISCTKEKMEEVSSVPEIPEGYVMVQLSAEGESTKTILNGNAIHWQEGDEISVHYEGADTPVSPKASSDGAVTYFEFSVPKDLTEMYAAYPAKTSELTAEGKISVSIPAEQDGKFSNGNYIVAKATKTGERWSPFYFKNAAAYLKVQTSDAEIKKIVFTAVGGENLTGKVTATFGESFTLTTEPTESSASVTLNIEGAGDHYAAVLPEVTLSKGLRVDFYKGNDIVSPSYYFDPETPVTTKRAQIINFSTLDQFVGNYYVSANGTGSGKDADHPMSVAKMYSLLKAKTDAAEIAAHAAQLNSSTIHFAAGSYDMSQSGILTLAFENYSEVALTLQGATEGETVFTGNETSQILRIAENTNITLNNITFTKAKGNGGGGAGVVVTGPSSKAAFNNCTFSKNTNERTSAAAQVDGLANATFTACEFTNNIATYAAAINVDKATSCLVDNCKFVGNSASSNDGGAVQIEGSCELKGCTFDSNSAMECGGAVILKQNETGTPVSFTGCIFLKNSSKKGGAIHAYGSGSKAVFTDCNFGDGTEANANTATSGNGAAAYAEDGVRFTFTRCNANCNKAVCGAFLGMTGASNVTIDGGSFMNNTATTSGGAIQVDSDGTKTAVLVVKNAEFAGNKANNGGGAIRLLKEQDTAAAGYTDITIEKCTFSGNLSYNGYGGALDLRNSGKSIVRDCTFEGNSTDIDARYAKGGAINCCAGNVEGGTIEILSCIFKGNGTKGGTGYDLDMGGAVNIGGNGSDYNSSFVAYINDCVFQGNHSTQGGAINVAKGTMYMNACSFTGNYITYRYGTTLLAHFGTKLRMNNISIANDSYSTTADEKQQTTWLNIGTADILLSNATLIGENQSKTAFTKGDPMLIRFDSVTFSCDNFIHIE